SSSHSAHPFGGRPPSVPRKSFRNATRHGGPCVLSHRDTPDPGFGVPGIRHGSVGALPTPSQAPQRGGAPELTMVPRRAPSYRRWEGAPLGVRKRMNTSTGVIAGGIIALLGAGWFLLSHL